MEREIISCSSSTSNLRLPPGFRFHPSDEELIVHYLQSKATSRPLPAYVIAEIDLYKYNPWELPSTFCAEFTSFNRLIFRLNVY